MIRSACNPLCLDTLMWTIAHRATLFRRVQLLDSATLVTTSPIAKNDIVAYIPSSICFSANTLLDPGVPSSLKCNIEVAAQELKWFPGMNKIHFSLLSLMTMLQFARLKKYSSSASSSGNAENENEMQNSFILGGGGGQGAHISLLSQLEEVVGYDSALSDEAVNAIEKNEFIEAAQPIINLVQSSSGSNIMNNMIDNNNNNSNEYDNNIDLVRAQFLRAYLAFERRSVVVWAQSSGLKSFSVSPFASSEFSQGGTMRALVPLVDLCRHSSQPTCVVGFGDQEVAEWLRMERGMKNPSADAVVLQATRDLQVGEELTVDRSLMTGFSTEKEFVDFFGHQV